MSDGTKPTNPKDAIGSDKLPLHLVPSVAIAQEALAFLDGALKYGRSNWREAGVRATIYYDAMRRHLDAWIEGEDADPASGLSHLAHVRACAAILLDAEAANNLTDDRNYPIPGWRKSMDQLTAQVVKIKGQHAHRRDVRHYTRRDVMPAPRPVPLPVPSPRKWPHRCECGNPVVREATLCIECLMAGP